MCDHPKVLFIKRGGKYRRAFMYQPYLPQGVCFDLYRCAAMEI